MSTREAAKYYASIGIVTHPLNGCQAECSSPGKQPILKDWQKIEKPFKDIEMDRLFKEDNNIGYVCGACSNLTVIDVDWPRKGIWEYVFLNVDMSRFIKVSHTEGKCHFLFQHCKELNAGNYKVLGFDILSDGPVTKGGASYIAGDNCVCAPSIHRDGNKYQIDGNIEDRIKMPDGIIARLNDLINKYNEIT
ncbi:MAG: bifunctional DNA primase/polymerase, partial [Chlamydiales bacterium]|nr:bifunctional DNA primase/polymerase [Chlamydiales bacterium]